MSTRDEIPLDTRNPVMQLRKEKKSYREIDNIVKISRARVQSRIKNFFCLMQLPINLYLTVQRN